jgi:glycosyltransferase involved in cell wall biosynthesis
MHIKKQPRVLFTSYSGELGGMELRMAQEARLLSVSGYEPIVATKRFVGFDKWATDLRGDGIRTEGFYPRPFFEEWKWRRFNKWWSTSVSARVLSSYRADLVHVAFCWTTYGASALYLAHHCGVPTVISVHNAFPRADFSAWHGELLKNAFQSVRGIYAVSESALQHFLDTFGRYIGAETIVDVIPNGVDTSRFIPSLSRRLESRARLGLAPDALVIGSVARLSQQKRPAALVKLFATLREEFPHLYLVLVGSGPLEAELRRLTIQLSVDKFVVFAGFQQSVETLIPAFDLHLLLSKNEGFGISTIEAMSCEIPAVGTNVPGTADVLKDSDGGILVPLDDEAAARESVSRLLKDPLSMQRMGKKGRIEAISKYSKEHIDEKLLKFYRQTI